MGNKNILLFIILILAFAIINFFAFSSENTIIALTSFILLLSAIFLVFLLGHKKYNHLIKIVHSKKILILCYVLLFLNILLQRASYSIEWAFAVFVLSAVLFYDFKIDSRFLIFPALLLLGYIPFLLMGKYNSLAETTAIYVYYFLVVGVGLQFIENVKKEDNSLDFDKFFSILKEKTPWISLVIVAGVFTIVAIITSRIYNINFIDFNFWKYTLVYLFCVAIIFYLISLIKEEE